MSGYPQLKSGSYSVGSPPIVYQLDLGVKSNVFIKRYGDSATNKIYDSSLSYFGNLNGRPMSLDPGSYIVSTSVNGSNSVLSVYIPSSYSYENLPTLSNGVYKANSFVNFYKLMIQESGGVFITAAGDNARGYIYDDGLNFVGYTSSTPITLDPGNYIVVATYNGYKNGSLSVTAPQSMLTDFSSYQALSQYHVLEKNNVFEGEDLSGLDIVHGFNGNDRFVGRGDGWGGGYEPDKFFGGSGVDTSVYRGFFAEYVISQKVFSVDSRLANSPTASGLEIIDSFESRDGTDYISDVERLEFRDVTLALDINGNAGQAYRLYQAAFARTPDNGGLKYWISNMDGGMTLNQVADGFLSSNEFKGLYGVNPRIDQYLSALYSNVLYRAPDQGGHDYWVNQVQHGMTNAQVLAGFSESNENKVNVIGVIQNGIELV